MQGPTWTSSLPPSTPGYCNATAGAWTGSGRTITVTPGQSLQAAINAASPGDTVELADGVYTRVQATITKAIRLRAQHQFGAVLVGNATPRTANDTSVGTPTGIAIQVRGTGVAVEGLEIRYYDTAIAVDDSTNTLVQGNRAVSSYGVGIELWDTRNSEVRCNELLDPYLADDPTASLTTQSIGEAQMDYGVNSYGGINARVEHNYFFGIFNQALSFKEGNLDAYAGYNTFEGFNLTALFFGQNIPHNGPYDYTGLPVGPDRGTLVAEYNVFRAVYGVRGASKVVYFARSPIRVWHVDATTILRGNVIESSQQGFLLECRAGASAGCASGTILLQDNVVGGRVRDLNGSLTNVNRTAGVLLFAGLPAAVTLSHNLFAMVPTTIGNYSDGVSGTPSVAQSGTTVMSATSASLPLRQARATTDPDLSFPASL
jgi:parallel beta-helix repeat protein